MKDATISPARLMKLYERISDAEDAIPRLRGLVLDLAVRGKLVEQDAGDEPAAELLKRAIASKRHIRSERGINRGEDPEFSELEGESDLPAHWVGAYLADFGLVLGGKRLPAGASFSPEATDHIYIRVTDMKNGSIVSDGLKYISADVQNQISKYTIDSDDIYITIAGTIGDVGEVPEAFHGHNLTENAAKIVFREIDREFLIRALRSKGVQDQFTEKTKQMAQPKLALKRILGARIPFPPLAEQHRIVAKVDELMALCDQLEQARAGREAVRDRLTTASLARMTAHDTSAEDFPTHAAFALEALPAFTTRPDQIKTLRQTIMNLAVRGKLVKQDRANGSGAKLMANIASSIGPRKFTRVDHNLIDFAVPEGWDLQCLDAITQDGPKNGLSPTKTENPTAPKAITLTATTSGQFDGRHFKHVDVPLEAAEAFWLQPNDLLFQRGNTPEYVGMAAIYDGPEREFLYPDLIMRVRIYSEIDLRFVHLWCISPVARNYLMANATGAQKTMPKINQGVLKALPIPLPPLAEQHRIVAKVDALMALCDQLEASLTTSTNTRSKLLNALLHEALEPATETAGA